MEQKNKTRTLLALSLLAVLPFTACLEPLEEGLPGGDSDEQGELDLAPSEIDFANDDEIDLEYRALEIDEDWSYHEEHTYGSCDGRYWGRRCWRNSDCPRGSRCNHF